MLSTVSLPNQTIISDVEKHALMKSEETKVCHSDLVSWNITYHSGEHAVMKSEVTKVCHSDLVL